MYFLGRTWYWISHCQVSLRVFFFLMFSFRHCSGKHFRFELILSTTKVGFLSREDQWWTLNQNLVSGKTITRRIFPRFRWHCSHRMQMMFQLCKTIQVGLAGKQRWHDLLSAFCHSADTDIIIYQNYIVQSTYTHTHIRNTFINTLFL